MTISTDGFGLGMVEPNLDRLQERLRCGLPSVADSTSSVDLTSGYEAQTPVRCFIGAVLTAFGTIMRPSESSRQIHPVWMSYVRRLEEEQVAEFFEPVEFTWDDDVYVARRAARRYSQQTHADY